MKTWQTIYNNLAQVAKDRFVDYTADLHAALLIGGLSSDTRTLKKGDLFIALTGNHSDGAQFISQALKKGVIGIICDATAQAQLPTQVLDGVPYWVVQDSAFVLGHLAASYYGHPTQSLTLIGVTGTNGKTTIATLLAGVLQQLGKRVGCLSSVNYQLGPDRAVAATHTTPDTIRLHKYMAEMKQAGCTHVTMEVSSHGIHQQRIVGLDFDGGVFTNITHDHLDYHKTFDAYLGVKKSFFDALPSHAFALVNADDPRGLLMLQNTQAQRQHTYSLRSPGDYSARIIEDTPHGLTLRIADREVTFRLSGSFNAYNLVAIAASAHVLGMDMEEVLRVLSDLPGVPGRLEHLPNTRNIHVIIDFAHTPDALEQVLKNLSTWAKQAHARLLSVVGCGGNKDKTKRPYMGKMACKYSDISFFTSDNPRDEDPSVIIQDMQQALTASELRSVYSIVDREEAIAAALDAAESKDILLVAGKGCETFQEIAGHKESYSDKAILEQLLTTSH